MRITKATRKSKKLRMSISGTPGAGKTLGALMMAKELAGPDGKILVFDTEFGRASLHADYYDFDVVQWGLEELEEIQRKRKAGLEVTDEETDIKPPTFEDYIKFIRIGETHGYDVMVIDSVTPEWEDIKARQQVYAKKFRGNDYAGWGPALRDHAKFVNKVLYSTAHLILTVRSKEKNEITQDRKVISLGVGEEQQKDLRFFMDFVFAVPDRVTHELIIEKAPTDIMEKYQGVVQLMNPGLAKTIKTWLDEGVPAETADLISRIQELAVEYMSENPDDGFSLPSNLGQLSEADLIDLGKELRAKYDNLKEKNKIKSASATK